MNYAIIRKSDDMVEYVRTSADANLDERFYQVTTSHVFSPPAHQAWWKNTDGLFTNNGPRTSPEQDNVSHHLAAYASILAAAGFEGDPQDIDQVEAWFETAIDAVTDLNGLKILMKAALKASGRAQAAAVYGWERSVQ